MDLTEAVLLLIKAKKWTELISLLDVSLDEQRKWPTGIMKTLIYIIIFITSVYREKNIPIFAL